MTDKDIKIADVAAAPDVALDVADKRSENYKHVPKLLGKAYFQRKKACPFSGSRARQIDYKDVKTLSRFVSDYGKILPSHITGVNAKKQRELTTAIKRARMLALLPYSSRNQK